MQAILQVSPEQVRRTGTNVILWYMPTCPACIRYKPEFEKTIKLLPSSVKIYAIDVSRYMAPVALSGEEVQLVPSVSIIKPGQPPRLYRSKTALEIKNIAC